MTINEIYNKYKGFTNSKGCWLIQKLPNHDGYIRVLFNGKNVYLHRLILSISLNLDYNDKSWQANHKKECYNKLCFNPEHLYKGDHQDNMIDRSNRITHCPNGHEYNELNPKHHKGCRICYKVYSKTYYQAHKQKWTRSRVNKNVDDE